MTEVIGPIDLDTWNTLKFLRESMLFYKENRSNNKYGTALKREKDLFDYILTPFKQCA